jgi:plastocyanin
LSRTGVSIAALLAAAGLALAVQVPVSMVDFAFSPDSIQVNVGDSVVWTNTGNYIHTSTSGVNGVWDSLWDSGNLAHGATFVREFATDGTFHYFCRHHAIMTGVVVVGTGGVNETPGRGVRRVAGFPNPFRTGTTLQFAPGGPASGNIRVFAASGRLVRTLPLSRSRSATWDGRDHSGQEVGPGVYFCRCGKATTVVTRLR